MRVCLPVAPPHPSAVNEVNSGELALPIPPPGSWLVPPLLGMEASGPPLLCPNELGRQLPSTGLNVQGNVLPNSETSELQVAQIVSKGVKGVCRLTEDSHALCVSETASCSTNSNWY